MDLVLSVTFFTLNNNVYGNSSAFIGDDGMGSFFRITRFYICVLITSTVLVVAYPF